MDNSDFTIETQTFGNIPGIKEEVSDHRKLGYRDQGRKGEKASTLLLPSSQFCLMLTQRQHEW